MKLFRTDKLILNFIYKFCMKIFQKRILNFKNFLREEFKNYKKIRIKFIIIERNQKIHFVQKEVALSFSHFFYYNLLQIYFMTLFLYKKQIFLAFFIWLMVFQFLSYWEVWKILTDSQFWLEFYSKWSLMQNKKNPWFLPNNFGLNCSIRLLGGEANKFFSILSIIIFFGFVCILGLVFWFIFLQSLPKKAEEPYTAISPNFDKNITLFNCPYPWLLCKYTHSGIPINCFAFSNRQYLADATNFYDACIECTPQLFWVSERDWQLFRPAMQALYLSSWKNCPWCDLFFFAPMHCDEPSSLPIDTLFITPLKFAKHPNLYTIGNGQSKFRHSPLDFLDSSDGIVKGKKWKENKQKKLCVSRAMEF